MYIKSWQGKSICTYIVVTVTKKLSRRDVSSMLKAVKRDLKLSASKLAKHIQNCRNVTVTRRAVVNFFHGDARKSPNFREKL